MPATAAPFFVNIHKELSPMDLMAAEWQIIANPNALTEQRALLEKKILTELDERGVNYTLHIAKGTGKGIEIAEELCRSGKRHLIVVGGDGSVNEIVNGIYRSEVNPSEVYLAIIPLGTGNDFCRTLHYPEAKKIIDFFIQNEFHPTDVGIVESVNDEKVTARRHFINIAGFAFDAAVINETVNGKPKIFPSAVYLTKLVKVLFKYKATRVRVTTDNDSYEDSLFTIAVGNAQYNGNGMRQVPMADPHDGMLDIVTIRKIGPLKVVANVKRLFRGKHIQLKEVRATRTAQVELTSPLPLLGEVEGELLQTGNYRIRLEPKKLNILQA